jgi:crossover junction endodeoxyribonuclease RuvC
MIIAAIDPSMSNTAIVTSFPDDGAEGYRIRCFSSPPEGRDVRDRVSRYEKFVAQIIAYLEDCAVSHVVIEGYSYNSTGSVIYLGELGGILRFHLVDFPHLVEVSPTAVKKFATGKGNAKKEIVAADIARRYGVRLASADEYDAMAIWRLARCVFNIDPCENDAQREAVAKVLGVTIPKTKKPRKPKQPLPF